MCFTAPWGWQLRMTTVVACVAVGVPAAIQVSRGLPIGWVLLAVLMSSLMLMVRGYTVTPTHLLIHRLGWTTRWALTEPLHVQVEPGVMAGSWRTWGNTGLFAFRGRSRNRRLGPYRAFVTDPARTVVLRDASGTLVVSPDDPQRFAAAVLSRAQPTGAPATFR